MKGSDGEALYYFGENGLCAVSGQPITVYDAAKAGEALAQMHPRGTIGVGWGSSFASHALYHGLLSGILQNGCTVWDFGSCFESQFGYCLSRSMADYGVYVDVSGDGGLKMLSRGGLPLGEQDEKKFLGYASQERGRRVSYSSFGSVLPMENLRELYRIELIKSAVCTLGGMTVSVKSASGIVQSLMEEALTRLGARLHDGGLTLQISADGRNISAYDKVSDYIFTDRILLLACMDLFKRGQDVAVAASAPRVLDQLAGQWGRKALRYEDGFESPSDRSARNLGLRQPYLRDGLMLGIRLVSLLRENRCNLEELEKRLPGYAVVSRTIPVGPELLRGSSGMCLTMKNGEIRIRPAKAGKALFLVAEGVSSETASELCHFAEEELLSHRLPENAMEN